MAEAGIYLNPEMAGMNRPEKYSTPPTPHQYPDMFSPNNGMSEDYYTPQFDPQQLLMNLNAY
jgi:hypothetical protein